MPAKPDWDDHQKIVERRPDTYEQVVRKRLNEILLELRESNIHQTDMVHLLEKFSQCDTGRRAVVFGFTVGQPKPKQKRMPLDLTITNEQQIKVTLSPKTDTGKPAALDGKPSWTTLSGNAQVVVADDGLSAMLVSADSPGDTEVIIKADANLDPDPAAFEEISDIIRLHVIGATAKNLGLTAGTPEAKPVA